ncbi:MAG: hypothetical protein A2297_03570 [Elusimicrobia bacterium RIFOXYB2_FULL_48_7]|nr:MAG: hypothetical protein A2297_03570 [Elusimicrobia bacterium RIFOXYB2_FULL_48_7]
MDKVDWKNIGIKELAILVSGQLKKSGIDAVLVGGACVSIYSNNKYESMDLDYISPASLKDIRKALGEIGFQKGAGRHFTREDCPLYVEFPPGPVALGREFPVERFNTIKTLKLLTPTDCVKDRLAAFFHWNDYQSLEQALMVAKKQPVNLNEIKRWSIKERMEGKYAEFSSALKKNKMFK